MEIYPVDNIVHVLHDWGQVWLEFPRKASYQQSTTASRPLTGVCSSCEQTLVFEFCFTSQLSIAPSTAAYYIETPCKVTTKFFQYHGVSGVVMYDKLWQV